MVESVGIGDKGGRSYVQLGRSAPPVCPEEAQLRQLGTRSCSSGSRRKDIPREYAYVWWASVPWRDVLR